MTTPSGWTPALNLEAIEQVRRYSTIAAARMAQSNDPDVAEIGRQLTDGTVRPRDLLLSAHYRDTIDRALQHALDTRTAMTPDERAAVDAAASETMTAPLSDGRRDRSSD